MTNATMERAPLPFPFFPVPGYIGISGFVIHDDDGAVIQLRLMSHPDTLEGEKWAELNATFRAGGNTPKPCTLDALYLMSASSGVPVDAAVVGFPVEFLKSYDLKLTPCPKCNGWGHL